MPKRNSKRKASPEHKRYCRCTGTPFCGKKLTRQARRLHYKNLRPSQRNKMQDSETATESDSDLIFESGSHGRHSRFRLGWHWRRVSRPWQRRSPASISKTGKKLPCGTLRCNVCIVPKDQIYGTHFIFKISAGEIATILAKLPVARIRHFAIQVVCLSSSYLSASWLPNVARWLTFSV
jgi:hypothetical protein